MNNYYSDYYKSVLISLPHSIGGRLTISSIIDGFLQNNCKVTVFDELFQSKDDFKNIINLNKFDYLVGYDFAGIKLKKDNNLTLPTINYFSDEINKPTAGEGYKELKIHLKQHDNFVFYWDKYLCNIEKHNFPNLFYMPHFVNTEIYYPTNQPIEFDVIFTGRLDTDLRLNMWVNLLKSFPNLKFGWFAIEKHFKDAMQRLNFSEKNLVSASYQKFIDNEPEMAKIINSSKIVINTHSQGISSFNYRTFQTLACEKLLISDYREEAKDLFKNNELVFYFNQEELKDKINHFHANEIDYNKIIKNARACILKNHNAKKRIAEIISIVEDNINKGK